MTLLYIVLATAAGGMLSVVIAASLTVHVLGRVVKNLVSLSAGVLLATALLQVLPEAFGSLQHGRGECRAIATEHELRAALRSRGQRQGIAHTGCHEPKRGTTVSPASLIN